MDYPQATHRKDIRKIIEGWYIRRVSSVFKIHFVKLHNIYNGVCIRTSGTQTFLQLQKKTDLLKRQIVVENGVSL